MKRFYFDWAATAVPDVFTLQSPWGNPSSAHLEGRLARDALENARKQCAAVLGVPAEHLYFTSGGTESNTIIFHSLIKKLFMLKKGLALSSRAEHPSVGENIERLASLGARSAYFPLDEAGRVDEGKIEAVLDKCSEPPGVISLMLVNNETGVINSVSRVAEAAKARWGKRILVHSDMVQALGKIPVVDTVQVLNSASFSAHKIGGPRGIGLLYLNRQIDTLAAGGGQESGVRNGTENVAGSDFFAECIQNHAEKNFYSPSFTTAKGRMRMLMEGLAKISRCTIIPHCRAIDDERFSPWIVQTGFKDIPGEVMARLLDEAGFAVSTGSACHTGTQGRPVLEAMGIDKQTAFTGIRISQGWTTTEADISALLEALNGILKRY